MEGPAEQGKHQGLGSQAETGAHLSPRALACANAAWVAAMPGCLLKVAPGSNPLPLSRARLYPKLPLGWFLPCRAPEGCTFTEPLCQGQGGHISSWMGKFSYRTSLWLLRLSSAPWRNPSGEGRKSPHWFRGSKPGKPAAPPSFLCSNLKHLHMLMYAYKSSGVHLMSAKAMCSIKTFAEINQHTRHTPSAEHFYSCKERKCFEIAPMTHLPLCT